MAVPFMRSAQRTEKGGTEWFTETSCCLVTSYHPQRLSNHRKTPWAHQRKEPNLNISNDNSQNRVTPLAMNTAAPAIGISDLAEGDGRDGLH